MDALQRASLCNLQSIAEEIAMNWVVVARVRSIIMLFGEKEYSNKKTIFKVVTIFNDSIPKT